MKEKEIRAVYDEETLVVYQAYNGAIASSAVEAQTFVSPPFKMSRMTWIKPSFLWMMYRSGWSSKSNQEHVLSIRIKRSGWEWALKNSCISHYIHKLHESQESWKAQLKGSPVRVQWDPEKDINMQNLPHRAIQVGLSAEGVELYVNDWIVSVEDISPFSREVHSLVRAGKKEEAEAMLPKERLYPVSDEIREIIHGS